MLKPIQAVSSTAPMSMTMADKAAERGVAAASAAAKGRASSPNSVVVGSNIRIAKKSSPGKGTEGRTAQAKDTRKDARPLAAPSDD